MKRLFIYSLTMLILTSVIRADDLAASFEKPPASAKPWVYWFVLNGNMTKEGITADFEAMARVGIGGLLFMEVEQGTPKGPVDFASPHWMDLISHACNEAKRLGLEINLTNDAGWNGSGGPWITPELSMQKVVWSELIVEGAGGTSPTVPQPQAERGYYRDIAVLAMPMPVADARIPQVANKASAAGGTGSMVTDIAAQPAKFPAVDPGVVIHHEQIQDLTRKMDAAGKLAWTPPPGKWLIMRFGYTTNGTTNSPGPSSGVGLECDKLSKEAITFHFQHLIGKIVERNRAITGQDQALVGVHVDSWEIGSQNWTPLMREEFQRRCGYDLLSYLPTFSGRYVDGAEASERFLWDLRKTISDLEVQNYAGTLQELAHANGLRFTVEAYDSPASNMPYAGASDEPMGEFWTDWQRSYNCTEMASAAHTYGKRVVGAESFTANEREKWQLHPATLKELGDWELCEGINRLVVHRFAAQPFLQAAPGVCMGPWGVHYERTQTWWEQSKPWHEYLARCQHLLRQGLFVADIAYLEPEGAPRAFSAPGGAEVSPHIRGGYGFDGCAPEVVLTRMSVHDKRIVLPDGMSYSALVLPTVETMTPALLAKIQQMADAGALIVGPEVPPTKTPGLAGMGRGDAQLQQTAAALWSSGKIVKGQTAQEALAQRGVPPDFSSTPMLRHIHRRTDNTDIYFVSNPNQGDTNTLANFRVTGKQPELWWPDSGRIENAMSFREQNGVTRVPLRLEPHGSVFVVFRQPVQVADPIVALSHDGEPQPLLYNAGAKIEIIKATYGIPGDAEHGRDVTQRIQGIVDEGQTRVDVGGLAAGGDPAYGVVKTLVVEFTINGVKSVVKGQDLESINLRVDLKKGPQIVVAHAVYGVLGDPGRTRDVHARVQKLADAEQTAINVSDMAAGDDPAFGTVKTLELTFTVDGATVSTRGIDGEVVRLASQKSLDTMVELHGDPVGGGTLTTTQDGRYDLQTASGKTKTISIPQLPRTQEIVGPWQIRFAPEAGGPGEVTFPMLEDWSKRPEDGIRFYSGTAVYKTSFTVEPASGEVGWILDLGKVEVMAEVTLNGRNLGTLWKTPYRVDLSSAIRPGKNELELKVVNLWINRQIGDQNLPEDSQRKGDGTLVSWPEWLLQGKPSPTGRVSFASWRLWGKDDALVASGLIGPVRVFPVARVPVP